MAFPPTNAERAAWFASQGTSVPAQLHRESLAERLEVSLWLGLYRAIAWVDSKVRRKR